jgi:hypothetical protein
MVLARIAFDGVWNDQRSAVGVTVRVQLSRVSVDPVDLVRKPRSMEVDTSRYAVFQNSRTTIINYF